MARGRSVARRLAAFATTATIGLTLASCGDDSGDDADRPEIVVFAASSLAPAFEAYASDFDAAEVRFSFAGSDQLAAQIRQGLIPDLIASADLRISRELASDRMTGPPVIFAGNRIALAAPLDSEVTGLDDLTAPGVRIALGTEDVPVGAYAREALSRLPNDQTAAILANLASSEPSASGIVGKLSLGAVDAGFVYETDIRAAADRLTAVRIPRELRLRTQYSAAVPTQATSPKLAEQFLNGLMGERAGTEALVQAGFSLPSSKR